jgi:hypothetical protein
MNSASLVKLSLSSILRQSLLPLGIIAQNTLSPQSPPPSGERKRHVQNNALSLVNAMHITASVFINDDERVLHADYEEWLEELAPHEPISRYRHNRTGEACPR